jgi:hypothetical protein
LNMDSLLKSALEGLDNEESISIAPKRKIADNGGKDLKKAKPSVPSDTKDEGDKEPDAKEEESPKDASWNWTPKAYNGGGGYGGYQQRPPYNGGGGYGGYQQRPPYGGAGGYQQRPPYGGAGGYQQRPPYGGGYGGGGGYQQRPPYGGGGYQRRFY